ncbi:MAG: UDP-N-acetylmuramate dehydrogenase [Candidatus Eiseniibacteriota bacterium]
MQATDDIARELEELDAVRVARRAPLAACTTFRIGGPAELLVTPQSTAALIAVLGRLRRRGIEPFVLGAGSDLLVADQGLRGVVVRVPAGLEPITVDVPCLVAGAGRPLPELAGRARREGLAGLEFARGIPGSLGGTVVMNAGAWGREMADVVATVEGVDADGRVVQLPANTIAWAYRHAALPPSFVVTRATLQLLPDDPGRIAAREEAWHAERRRRQPLGLPSAGCVFRNPGSDCGAGQLIESAGLKGARVGGAEVSTVHANFIVNRGGATAAQVLELIERVRAQVARVHDVALALEIQLVGFDAVTRPDATHDGGRRSRSGG